MNVTAMGLDIAKNVFQVPAVDRHGKPVLRKQLERSRVPPYFANLPPCLRINNHFRFCKDDISVLGKK